MLSIGKDLIAKATSNIATFLKIAAGEEEYSFASDKIYDETQVNVLTNKKFLAQQIAQAEQQIESDRGNEKTNLNMASTSELLDYYTDQRCISYAYSERKKLFQTGWDSKLGDEYRVGYNQSLLKKTSEGRQ